MMFQMIAEMEACEKACKRAEFVAARLVPVDERIIRVAVRAVGAEIEQLQRAGDGGRRVEQQKLRHRTSSASHKVTTTQLTQISDPSPK